MQLVLLTSKFIVNLASLVVIVCTNRCTTSVATPQNLQLLCYSPHTHSNPQDTTVISPLLHQCKNYTSPLESSRVVFMSSSKCHICSFMTRFDGGLCVCSASLLQICTRQSDILFIFTYEVDYRQTTEAVDTLILSG